MKITAETNTLHRTLRAVIAAAAAAAILLLIVPERTSASQVEGFIVVRDTIVDLKAETMPAYYGTSLYLPGSVFSRFGMFTLYDSSQNMFSIEYGKRKLEYYVEKSTVDEKGNVTDNKAHMVGSLVFIQADFVCAHFGLTYNVIPNSPLSIVRLKDGREKLDDIAFLAKYKAELERMYYAYRNEPVPTPTPTPTPTSIYEPPTITHPEPSPSPGHSAVSPSPSDAPEPSPSPTPPPTYETVTLSFSFYDVSDAQQVRRIMSALEIAGIRGLFYVTEAEIKNDPALVREITGRSHSVGIFLIEGTYDEYKSASQVLFEAAAVRTPIIALSPDAADTGNEDLNAVMLRVLAGQVRVMAERRRLVFRENHLDFSYAGNTELPTIGGTHTELRAAAAEGASLQFALYEITTAKYKIERIVETTS